MARTKQQKNKDAAAAPSARPAPTLTPTPSKKFKKRGKGKSNAGPNAITAKTESKTPAPGPAPAPTPALAPTPARAPVPARASVHVPAPVANKSSMAVPVGVGQQPQKEKEQMERSSGFIFFCNGSTKQECFQKQVLGLPRGRKFLVDRIKPGARLFLYDFDVKLLYGIFRATSSGGLDLVPQAFQGKFPAQVKFQVEKDCIPLPETVFRSAIEENYDFGSKFQPDLNSKQVRKLCLMFQPVPRSEPQLVPVEHPIPSHGPPEDPYRPGHPLRAAPVEHTIPFYAPPEDPYRSGHPLRAPPTADSRYGAQYGPPANDPYIPAAHYPHGPPAPEPRHVPSAILHPNDPYFPAPPKGEVRAYYPESLGHSERYRVLQEVASRDPPPAAGRDYRSLTGEVPHAGHPDGSYYERALTRAFADIPSRQGYLMGGYDNPNYHSEGIPRTVSSRENLPNLPVSSRYSFAGPAPAYR